MDERLGTRRDRRATWILIGMGIAHVGMGCSADDARPERHPVQGQVFVRGEPATGAFVVFHPASGASGFDRPRAQVRPGGEFALTTFDEGDGAPAGDYIVTLEWWKSIRRGNEVVAGPNVVPARYAAAGTSPLRVAISEGTNTLSPFRIESK